MNCLSAQRSASTRLLGWGLLWGGLLLASVPASAQVRQIPIGQSSDPAQDAERREAAQLATLGQFDVFHEFRFRDRQLESGIDFVHQVTDDSARDYKPNHYDHGNGVVVADVDGDDLLDLYFVNQAGPNGLFKNLGNRRFRNVTEEAGVGLADRISAGASFADADNDGDADLYVTTVRFGNVLFENDGKGRFRDVTKDAGLEHVGHSSAGVFFDYDRDGLLDLLLVNVGRYTTAERGRVGYYVGLDLAPDGLPDAFGGHLHADRTETSVLYRNRGGLRFEDVTETMGLGDGSWSGDASPVDLNGDGYQDLYLLNMQGDDRYYENQEGKRFVDKTAEVFPRTPWGSMGIKFFDHDNDGRLDLLLTDMHSDMSQDVGLDDEKKKSDMQWTDEFLQGGADNIFGNAFYVQQANGSFRELSDDKGLENYWPWGLSVGDLNADGYEDVFIASSMNFPFRYGVNSVLLNNRGEKFLDSEYVLGVEPRRGGRVMKGWFVMDCSGADRGNSRCQGREGRFELLGTLGSRSSAIFDLDQDGDLDIVTNDFNSEPMVLISDLSSQRELKTVEVLLRGTDSNRDALGAVVTVKAGEAEFTKVNDGVSGYLSHSRMPLYFGLGEATKVDSVEVVWPSGKKQTVTEGLELNQRLLVVEP